MSNWKVGDKALCVKVGPLPYQNPTTSGNYPQLRLNYQYVVNNTHTCSCGKLSLDVGLTHSAIGKGTRCECGAISAPSDIHWCATQRFVKPDEAVDENENIEHELTVAYALGDDKRVNELLDKYNK